MRPIIPGKSDVRTAKMRMKIRRTSPRGRIGGNKTGAEEIDRIRNKTGGRFSQPVSLPLEVFLSPNPSRICRITSSRISTPRWNKLCGMTTGISNTSWKLPPDEGSKSHFRTKPGQDHTIDARYEEAHNLQRT